MFLEITVKVVKKRGLDRGSRDNKKTEVGKINEVKIKASRGNFEEKD